MNLPQLHLPEPFKVAYERFGQYRRSQQPRKKNGTFKKEGIKRWHRAVSTKRHLVKQNALIAREESSSKSDPGFRESQQNQKPKWKKKMKAAFGRMFSHKGRRKPASISREDSTPHGEALSSSTKGLVPKIVQELPSLKVFTRSRERKLSQNATVQIDVEEAETEEITKGNTLLLARRTTKRLSVTSLPSGLQKVLYSAKTRLHFLAPKKKKCDILQESDLTIEKLQMQVDDIVGIVTDKSMKLLAQRQAELQECELKGEEVLQSSKQFQKISKRTMRKYKWKDVCFLCACCF